MDGLRKYLSRTCRLLRTIAVGGGQATCAEDAACINRLHPDIPMVASADPGERIVMVGRDAGDIHIDPDEYSERESSPRAGLGVVHPLVGPVHINGAQAGDVIAVTIESIEARSRRLDQRLAWRLRR